MDRRWELDLDAHEAVHAAAGTLLVVVTCLAVAVAPFAGDRGRAAFGLLSCSPLVVAVLLAVVPGVPSRVLAGMLFGSPVLWALEVLDDRTSTSRLAAGGLVVGAFVVPAASFIVSLGVDGLLASSRGRAGQRGHGIRVGVALALALGLLFDIARRASEQGIDVSVASRCAAIALSVVVLLALARRVSRLLAWAAKAEPAVAARDLACTRSGALVKLEGAPPATRDWVFLERSDAAHDYRGDARAHARRWIAASALRTIEDRARRVEWLALFALVWIAVT
jgi:hypothetical protein